MSVGGERAAIDACGGGREEAQVGLEREDDGVGARIAASEPPSRRSRRGRRGRALIAKP